VISTSDVINAIHIKALFASLEGEGFEKRKRKTSGSNRGLWNGRALGCLFFFIIQNSPDLEELKNCIRGGFISNL
jgi:hypothetical protein